MWQRIQSVFLGIAILSLILGMIYPVWSASDHGAEYKLYPIYFLTRQQGAQGALHTDVYFPYCITAILMVAAITIAIMEIRRFNNRFLQVKLGLLNSLLLLGVVICNVIFSIQLSKAYPAGSQFELSLYLCVVAIVCNWLAVRFIRRDEKLVKDSDRIR